MNSATNAIFSGALITDILDHVKLRFQSPSPAPKIYIYSGHDVTLVNLMRALDVLEQANAKPDYAATIVFELHHSVIYDDDFEVKIVYYFNSEDKVPKQLHLPNCDSPCSFTNFEKAMNPVILKEYDEICQLV